MKKGKGGAFCSSPKRTREQRGVVFESAQLQRQIILRRRQGRILGAGAPFLAVVAGQAVCCSEKGRGSNLCLELHTGESSTFACILERDNGEERTGRWK